jgi:hypothetical protein
MSPENGYRMITFNKTSINVFTLSNRDQQMFLGLSTSRGYHCRFYSVFIFIKSKVLKWVHRSLRNCFSNAVMGKNQPLKTATVLGRSEDAP